MNNQWTRIQLRSLLKIPARNGLYKAKTDKSGSIITRWIKMKDLFESSFIHGQEMAKINVTNKELEKFGCLENDLLFGRTSLVLDGVGKCAIVRNITDIPVFESNLFRLRLNQEKACPKFYYYYFSSPIGRYHISTIAKQTAATSITASDLINIFIKVPPLPTQERIADILGTLDDKIELNRQMNRTLEAMARAIFKSWFVDFDPVYAKMEGRDYPLPAEVMDLFPDEMVESELGLIPKGWEAGILGNLAQNVSNGGTPSRKESTYWENGSIPWLKSGEVRQSVIVSTENKITEKGLKNSSAKIWPPYTTIVALYGATAGEVTLSAIETTANQACCGLQPYNNTKNYLYLATSRSTKFLASRARGSAQQNLSKSIVENFEYLIPSPEILIKFDQLITPFFEKIIINLEETDSLSTIRDTLLPMLISGEMVI